MHNEGISIVLILMVTFIEMGGSSAYLMEIGKTKHYLSNDHNLCIGFHCIFAKLKSPFQMQIAICLLSY